MFVPRLRAAALALAAGLTLSACVYDDGYGYGGVSVGYGNAGYYDPYDDGYGYGYGRSASYGRSPYYGWYDGYYYPGGGYYVYDQYRRPYRWNNRQQRYWVDRRRSYGGADYREDRRELRQNWQEFRNDRRHERREYRQDRRQDRRELRRENRRDRRY